MSSRRGVRVDDRRQSSLFATPEAGTSKWTPPEILPTLGGRYKRAYIDTETTGKDDPYGSDRMVGLVVALDDGTSRYLPFGHQGGGNLDKSKVISWAQRELRDMDLYFTESKFDIEMCRKDGIDFEAQGCRPHELQFHAGLLADYRRSFKLQDLGMDFVGRGKEEIDATKIWQMPAAEVGPYAEADGALLRDLRPVLWRELEKQNLTAVADLEDSIIYAVLAMERNGALLDLPKLEAWASELQHDVYSIQRKIHNRTGLKVGPTKPLEVARLLTNLGIPYGYTSGKKPIPNIDDEFLAAIDNELIADVRLARSLLGLDSKYVSKYLKLYKKLGILRYKLHQLKGDEYGTISGRFSSSSVNIQQVFKPSRQIKKYGFDKYVIRELFIPAPGHVFFDADADQIEYRLFGHYSGSRYIIDAYVNDPENTDFHELTRVMAGLADRDHAKTVNFCKVYGGGIDKMAATMGKSYAETERIVDQYDRKIPEVKTLMRKAMRIARKRGYVKTFTGRRARFPEALRLHSALNRVLQGTAADVMKKKIGEVYRERKYLTATVRFTVHDSLAGDLENPERKKQMKELLDVQSYNFRVPITWKVGIGPNWRAAA